MIYLSKLIVLEIYFTLLYTQDIQRLVWTLWRQLHVQIGTYALLILRLLHNNDVIGCDGHVPL